MIKHYFNKVGIYISVIQALVLLYSIFCSIDYGGYIRQYPNKYETPLAY